MDLFITTYGCDLEAKDGLFQLNSGEEVKTLSPELVETICIATSCTLSTNAIALALEHQIDITVISRHGKVLGRFWHGNYQTTSQIRKQQALLSISNDAMQYIADWIWNKFDRQITLLKNMPVSNLNFEAKYKSINTVLIEIESNHSKQKTLLEPKPAQAIRNIEAQFQKKYYDAINLILPEQFRFKLRSRQPALDAFNAALNYTYAILYQHVESAICKAGLDPYLGLHHVSNYNTKSFVFDFIEPYRPWADKVVIDLFRENKLTIDMFTAENNGMLLNEMGKTILIPAFNDYMHSDIPSIKMKLTRIELIQRDAYKFCKRLLKMVVK